VEVQVADGATLNVRPTPSTQQAPVGKLNDGDIVDVLAQVKGEAVSGNDLWFQIQAPSVTGYISAQFAQCTLKKPPVLTKPDGFYLPLECGKTSKIAQGNNGSFSHQGKSLYAYDFSLALNTPMTAMADGVVAYLYDKTGPGDPCYNGGDSSCFPYANYVVLKHGDGSLSTYKHLNKVSVSLKQFVKRGTVIGLSGSTGYSTGPHAHVMRMEDCGQYSCQSIPLKFQDVGGDQVPDQGQSVTSGNCP
jgi:murein DD-endopeptidase MepM/ murein hydrolase activator NlpD